MLAQDVAADAAADVAGAAGEASGFVTSATNWLVTEGPGLAVNFVFFLAILIIGFWIAKKLSAAAKKLAMRSPNVDETLGNFLGSIVGYVIKAFVIIAAIGKLGVEATSLVAVLGAATLAIGLALQGTLGNVAAGVMLMLFRAASMSIMASIMMMILIRRLKSSMKLPRLILTFCQNHMVHGRKL